MTVKPKNHRSTFLAIYFARRGHAGKPRTGTDPRPDEQGEAAGSATGAPVESGEQLLPDTDTADSRGGTDSGHTRRTTKQRRTDLDDYRRRYMQTPRIEDRKPVFVSRSTRDRLDRIVRLLGERKMSVSGFLENLARRHLDTHEEDIECWRKL